MDAVSPPNAATLASPGTHTVTAWPRSAQIAAMVLSILALALISVRLVSASRWATRPTEMTHQEPLRRTIDLNQADRVELLQVPGVGESMAERILAYRREHGRFTRLEDLTKIRGIGPATLQKIRPWLRVSPAEELPDEESEESKLPVRVAMNSLEGMTKEPLKAATSKKSASLDRPIDVNAASLEDLQKLPGIGPKMSQRIVNERARAHFKAIEDLRRVSGIGPKTLEKLRPFVTVKSQTRSVARVED